MALPGVGLAATRAFSPLTVASFMCPARCTAAVRKGVLAESTDTEAQWIEEWGGVDADLAQIVLPFIRQWRLTRPHRLLKLSGNLGGTRPSSHAPGQDRRAAFVTLLPRLEAMPLLQRFKSYLQSNQWVAQRVQYSGGYKRAPVAARDDPRVPASFGVAASDRPRLRLCIVVLHLDKDGWVQMDHFGSHSQRLSLVEALARLLDGVRWCVFIVITCGGWPMDTGRQEQLQRLFREHQCALLTSSRPSVPYQDPGDATVDALLRCGADLAVRGLLDVRPEPHHSQKEDGVQTVETMVDQLVDERGARSARLRAQHTSSLGRHARPSRPCRASDRRGQQLQQQFQRQCASHSLALSFTPCRCRHRVDDESRRRAGHRAGTPTASFVFRATSSAAVGVSGRQ